MLKVGYELITKMIESVDLAYLRKFLYPIAFHSIMHRKYLMDMIRNDFIPETSKFLFWDQIVNQNH